MKGIKTARTAPLRSLDLFSGAGGLTVLHECLVTPDECAEDQGDRYVIYHDGTYGGLSYTSDKNEDWLDATRLAALL